MTSELGADGRARRVSDEGLPCLLLKDGIEDLEDKPLTRLGELPDALEVALDLGGGTALAGLSVLAEEAFDGGAEGLGEGGEHGGGDSSSGDLEVADLLLGEAEEIGELGLGETLLVA